MYNIISNQDIDPLFKKAFLFIIKKHYKEYILELNFISTISITRLNRQYRNINKSTDILTFPVTDIFGQIFICKSIVKKYKLDYQKYLQRSDLTYNKSLLYVFIHGLAHIIGYDHNNNKEKKQMEKFVSDVISNL